MILGLIIGAFIGIAIMCLLQAGKDYNDEINKNIGGKNED